MRSFLVSKLHSALIRPDKDSGEMTHERPQVTVRCATPQVQRFLKSKAECKVGLSSAPTLSRFLPENIMTVSQEEKNNNTLAVSLSELALLL